MLYSPTNNTKYIYIYTLLIEIFIGFTAFALFFGVFANYIYDDYLKSKVINDLSKSLSFYQLNNIPPDIDFPPNITNLKILQNSNIYYKKKSIDDSEKNNKYRNNKRIYFIYLIVGITFILLLLLIIPLLIGIIPFSLIDFKFIGINYLIHIVFVISFEVILLLGVLPFFKSLNVAVSMNTISGYI